MANMGLRDLALAAPCALDLDEARMMACHAADLLDARREFATLAEAVADSRLVMGTTVRMGLYRQHARGPREWAPRALAAAQQGRVSLVFGREDSGLSNEELALCTQIIHIPSHPRYPSLNVAQAVMICCYELFCATGAYEPPREKSEEAPSHLRERMFEMWRKTLLHIGFMDDDKADHMMYGLRRILSRGSLTVDDVRILMGIARQSLWAAGHATRDQRTFAARRGARGAEPIAGEAESG
jgi:tRNA/rRNA methyltransferase